MQEEATIYDFMRMCKTFEDCKDCLLNKKLCHITLLNEEELDELNKIILKWCQEHPTKIRQEMTENEIMMALGCCKTDAEDNCKGCPIEFNCPDIDTTIDAIFDIILHKNVKIERLIKKIEARDKINYYNVAQLRIEREKIRKLNQELDSTKAFCKKVVAERDLYLNKISNLEKGNQKQKAMLEAIDDEMFPLPFETDFDKAIKSAKSEAIKEFAERLKKQADMVDFGCGAGSYSVVFTDAIEDLIKEMAEKQNDKG